MPNCARQRQTISGPVVKLHILALTSSLPVGERKSAVTGWRRAINEHLAIVSPVPRSRLCHALAGVEQKKKGLEERGAKLGLLTVPLGRVHGGGGRNSLKGILCLVPLRSYCSSHYTHHTVVVGRLRGPVYSSSLL